MAGIDSRKLFAGYFGDAYARRARGDARARQAAPAKRRIRVHVADHADLEPLGERGRFQCLEPFASPWWFALAPQTQGTCWVLKEGYAGNLRVHHAPESGFSYVFDYSS